MSEPFYMNQQKLLGEIASTVEIPQVNNAIPPNYIYVCTLKNNSCRNQGPKGLKKLTIMYSVIQKQRTHH